MYAPSCATRFVRITMYTSLNSIRHLHIVLYTSSCTYRFDQFLCLFRHVQIIMYSLLFTHRHDDVMFTLLEPF